MGNSVDPHMADAERTRILEAFGRYLNPQKVRVLKAAGLDVIETERSGAWVEDIDGRRHARSRELPALLGPDRGLS